MTRSLRFATVAAVASLLACGTAPNAAPCNQTSDCTGDAVCAQNLCQQGYRLSMAPTGDGAGRITSAPDAFNCSAACSAPLAAGTNITLHAIPDSNSDFLGWSGGCSGTGDCPVTMDAAKSVTGVFRSNHVVFTSSSNVDGSDSQSPSGGFNVWRAQADGSGRKALTRATSGVLSIMPRSSPDGRTVIFSSVLKLDGTDAINTNSTANVWKVNADGSGLTPLTRGTATGDGVLTLTPEWSRDGNRVVFVSARNVVNGSDTTNANSATNVWQVNADGTGLLALTTLTAAGTSTANAHISPDGSQIVFTSSRNLDGSNTASSPSVANLFRVAINGSGLTPLTRTTAASTDSSFPQWSPDGSKIAFTSTRNVNLTDTANPNGTSNIWVVNSDGTGLLSLTKATAAGASSLAPRWSPDGSRIAFTSSLRLDGSDAANLSSTNNVWVVNPNSSGLTPLTRATQSGDTGQLNFPQWSLDGSRILFASSLKLDGTDASNAPNGTLNLWRFNVSGGNLTPLTRGTASGASSFSCTSGSGAELWLLQIALAMGWMRRRSRRR